MFRTLFKTSLDWNAAAVRLIALVLTAGLAACGGGGSGGGSGGAVLTGDAPLSTRGTVLGTIGGGDVTSGATLVQVPVDTLVLTMDDRTDHIPIDGRGRFRIDGVADGHHTLHLRHADGIEAHLPFRMLEGNRLSLGRIDLSGGRVMGFTGFDGYHFGFVDENGDGINDQFADADGDGICDAGTTYAGYAYMMPQGFVDGDGDGLNDRFRDADGDGQNDLDGMPYGHGFGFVDADGDGVNDYFMDVEGDGICDLTSMPYRHPFGWRDANEDGRNDLFTDANGDGINDLTGDSYVARPGWADLDGDHLNDFFRDADGDGVNDLTDIPMGYGHGFGWMDLDGDGVNDRFVDADGDGVNDLMTGVFAGMHHGYGFMAAGVDANGDGLDDVMGDAIPHGFGWVDADHDHMNDYFRDADGNGVNDLTGHGYPMGFGMGGMMEDGTPGHDGWPRHRHGMGSGM